MNRLSGEASPYLRQHAGNPVDWYPWGPEAFDRAEAEDRPVLLSIGYSSCHWCHVMAHESFEDHETAALMNRLFVNVKVDREERPDVDAIYMEATQATTGRGGWPMTVFMTPTGEPFFCGTYYPRTARAGMPSFTQVCEAIADAWHNRRDDVLTQAGHLTDHLRAQPELGGATPITIEAIDMAGAALVAEHDHVWGGFGPAPKFPSAMSIDLLLRRHRRHPDPDALAAARHSLDAMAAGGIWDHLGGGFSRYSVDEQWLVPHFEKMLYDNALLVRPYLHSWQMRGADDHLDVVEQIIGYVLADLAHPDGGWYSAEDADSDGVEGKFYVWRPEEIVTVLGERDAATFMDHYGVTEAGNFEGTSILRRPIGGFSRPGEIVGLAAELRKARDKRVRPGLDDKVLCEWNALFLAALAEAASAVGRQDWTEAALTNAGFLLKNLRRDDQRWMRSWQAASGPRHLGYAQDYAAVVDAYTRVYELTGAARWLEVAASAADGLVELFWDPDARLFWTTGSDAEPLLCRPRDLQDNATPSAQSMAAVALIRLAPLVDRPDLREIAESVLNALAPVALRHPRAFSHLLEAAELVASGLDEVVITGDRPDLLAALRARWRPNAVLSWGDRLAGPLWEGRDEGHGYVCRNYACGIPVSDPADLEAQIS